MLSLCEPCSGIDLHYLRRLEHLKHSIHGEVLMVRWEQFFLCVCLVGLLRT